jgi:NADPH:quinone reductase
MLGIQVTSHGGPEKLEYREVPHPEAGEDGLVVRLVAAGVNFIDVYHRTGLYPKEPPFVPGMEGAGVVTEVGRHVTGFGVGDRVAWSSNPASYAQFVRVDPAGAVHVPEGVDLEVAAAAMLQGMTAHYLVGDTFPLTSGHRCLVHAGAGGVGLLTIQMAKARGAEVFTTVGSEEKAALAAAAGADHVIDYTVQDFVEAVELIAGPRPLHVVYDGVGKETFDGSLRLLRRRGTMVAFGNASGPVEPLSPLRLMREGSLFLTRPTLFDHVATREELEGRATAVFDLIAGGALDVRIGARVPLAEAADAHRALEARRTTGKVVLVPA